jgi:hypothetical protein
MKQLAVICAFLSCGFIHTSDAQSPQSFWDRVFVGGGLGGQLSADYTYVNVSPSLGYWITDRWSAGAGFTFQYFDSKLFNYSTSIYGPTAFTRYHLLRFLFATAEFEYLFLRYKDDLLMHPISVTSPNLLLGGGLSYSLGGSASAYAMILYNVLENQYTPYSNPVIRFGVAVGL